MENAEGVRRDAANGGGPRQGRGRGKRLMHFPSKRDKTITRREGRWPLRGENKEWGSGSATPMGSRGKAPVLVLRIVSRETQRDHRQMRGAGCLLRSRCHGGGANRGLCRASGKVAEGDQSDRRKNPASSVGTAHPRFPATRAVDSGGGENHRRYRLRRGISGG